LLLLLLLLQACPATCSITVTKGSGNKVTKEVTGECSTSLKDGFVTYW
jgi:hypothetical protein